MQTALECLLKDEKFISFLTSSSVDCTWASILGALIPVYPPQDVSPYAQVPLSTLHDAAEASSALLQAGIPICIPGHMHEHACDSVGAAAEYSRVSHIKCAAVDVIQVAAIHTCTCRLLKVEAYGRRQQM